MSRVSEHAELTGVEGHSGPLDRLIAGLSGSKVPDSQPTRELSVLSDSVHLLGLDLVELLLAGEVQEMEDALPDSVEGAQGLAIALVGLLGGAVVAEAARIGGTSEDVGFVLELMRTSTIAAIFAAEQGAV